MLAVFGGRILGVLLEFSVETSFDRCPGNGTSDDLGYVAYLFPLAPNSRRSTTSSYLSTIRQVFDHASDPHKTVQGRTGPSSRR